MSTAAQSDSAWSVLLSREYLPKVVTLAMALWLHAANSMLTATTIPSAVEEIGGLHLISWTFALYLAGSITAAASISMLVAKVGLPKAIQRAALVFIGGCIIVATAPSMPVLLTGRVLQGLGGGGLVALVYISQDRFFPNYLMPRVVGFLSIVWTLSAFTGPVIGGAFATIGEWRLAYWAFAFQGLLLIPAVHFLLEGGSTAIEVEPDKIPIVRVSFLCLAILLFSLSGAHFDVFRSPLMVFAGCLALMFFILRDKSASKSRIMPSASTDLGQPMANGILLTFLLNLCLMSFLVYGPFILIKLYHLTPFEAGMVLMAEATAWGIAAILFSGSSAETEPRLIRIGSALVVIGLIATAYTLPAGPLWAVVVAVAIGNAGFGMMWGFIIKRVIGAAPALERDRTASMMPITQQTGFALGAALCGLIANGFGISDEMPVELIKPIAFWLFTGFVPVAILGNIFAWRFVDDKRSKLVIPVED